MPDFDVLKNEGILALNRPESSPAEKTVVVLGPARGGTTMVASVLQAMHVPMGDNLGPVLEDVVLSKAIESRDIGRLTEIVAHRNAMYPIWGWKRPAAFEYADVWQGRFRNPHIIAIFRDPFAIANRNRISMLSDVFENMQRSVRQLGTLVSVLQQQKGPLLLCSYEKVIGLPETFVRAVDNFLDLNAAALWPQAIHRVDPGSTAYVNQSRITQSVGALTGANADRCDGWAFYRKAPSRVVKVQIFVNSRPVQVVEAKLPRPELKSEGLHPTGNCGFALKWPDGERPKVGDQVEARVEGDIKPLKGSPWRVGSDSMSAAKKIGKSK